MFVFGAKSSLCARTTKTAISEGRRKKDVTIVGKYSDFPHNNSSSGIHMLNPLIVVIFDELICHPI
jgi:hypothetical protein